MAKLRVWDGSAWEQIPRPEEIEAAVDASPRIHSLEAGQQSVNLRSEGFALDGVTDETAAFQSLLNSVAPGTQIVLDERAKMAISSQVTITGKSVSIVGKGDATIKVLTKLSVPAIMVSDAEGVRVSNITLEGAESTYDGVYNTQAYALSISSCPYSQVSNLLIKNFSRGVILTAGCHYSTVSDVTFRGLINAYSTNSNYHSGVFINSSNDCVVTNIVGTDLGNVVLAGGGSHRLRVVTPTGNNVYDAGVYLSSGHDCEVYGAVMQTREDYNGTIGNGVSMKGDRNKVIGGTFINMGLGARITGLGVDDGDGTDGQGARIIGATAINCKVAGFQIGGQSGLPSRDSIIMGCYVEGGGSGYTNHLGDPVNPLGGIVLYGGRNNQVSNNVVVGFQNTYSMHLIGAGTGGVRGSRISENNIRHTSTNSQSTAVYVTGTSNTDFLDNEIECTVNAYAFRVPSGSSNLTFRGNRVIRGAGVTLAGLRVDPGTSNIRIIDNPYMSVSDISNEALLIGNDPLHTGNLTITGSRGSGAAYTDLIVKLAAAGLISNQTTS